MTLLRVPIRIETFTNTLLQRGTHVRRFRRRIKTTARRNAMIRRKPISLASVARQC
jgi:hypothetical protein